MKTQLLCLCLLMTLTACSDGPGEFDRMITGALSGGGGGSGGGSVPPPAAQPAPAPGQPNLTGTAATKMLIDPEASESNGTDYVWADSKEAARNLCQRTAERNGWRLDDVDDGEGIALQTGRKRFTCYFTMFGAPRQ